MELIERLEQDLGPTLVWELCEGLHARSTEEIRVSVNAWSNSGTDSGGSAVPW